MGPRTGLDGCGEFRLNWDSIPGPYGPQQDATAVLLSRATAERGLSSILRTGLFIMNYKF